MKKILISLLLITFLMVPTAVLAQDAANDAGQPADSSNQTKQVAATVNGEEITSRELARQANLNQILQQVSRVDQQLVQILSSSEAGKKVLNELKQAKLNGLIDNVLLKQAAEESKITLTQSEKNEIYKKQKDAILKQNKMTEKQFISILKKQGYENEAAYKKEFLNNPQIKINKLIEQKVLSDIVVSEKELQQAYDQNKKAFAQSGQDTSFKKLKPQLKQMLKQQKQSQAINQYLQKLRKEAEIKRNI